MSTRRETTDSIAVLGGAGFLGARVVRRALCEGARSVQSLSRDPARFPRLEDPRLRRVVADALREGELEHALVELAPARIVLCTALARGADCDAYPELARKLNVELPGRVARVARELGARLVLVSSDLVFGGTAPPPAGFSETAAPSPLSLYGQTKLDGERAVLAEYPAALVCRLPLLFGESEGRGLGASDSLSAAAARGESLALFTDEWRTPLDVDDAAAALVELASGDLAGLLHVAGPTRLSRWELGQLVLDPQRFDEHVRATTRADLGLAACRPEDTALDASRARGLLRCDLRSPAAALVGRA